MCKPDFKQPSSDSVESSLFKSWSQGGGGGVKFYIEIYKENLQTILGKFLVQNAVR